jgi:hypothetical protein
MSVSDHSNEPAARTSFWVNLVRLNLGMILFGGSLGLSLPFTADLLNWDSASHQLSIIALLCAVPLTGAGIFLIAASCHGLKALDLDPFRQDTAR